MDVITCQLIYGITLVIPCILMPRHLGPVYIDCSIVTCSLLPLWPNQRMVDVAAQLHNNPPPIDLSLSQTACFYKVRERDWSVGDGIVVLLWSCMATSTIILIWSQWHKGTRHKGAICGYRALKCSLDGNAICTCIKITVMNNDMHEF